MIRQLQPLQTSNLLDLDDCSRFLGNFHRQENKIIKIFSLLPFFPPSPSFFVFFGLPSRPSAFARSFLSSKGWEKEGSCWPPTTTLLQSLPEIFFWQYLLPLALARHPNTLNTKSQGKMKEKEKHSNFISSCCLMHYNQHNYTTEASFARVSGFEEE